jgi:hypothetical protein
MQYSDKEFFTTTFEQVLNQRNGDLKYELIYNKGVVFAHELRKMIGKEKFLKIIRDTYNKPDKYITLTDFENSIKQNECWQEYLKLFERNGKLAVKIVPAIHSKTKIYLRNKRHSFHAGETFYHPRQFMMYEPVAVMSAANPSYLAFEQANMACFPFAPYARRFFMNFLALPDIPMEKIPQRSDAKGLVVKMGKLGNKTYIAIINTKFSPINDATIFLPIENANIIKLLVNNKNDIPFFIDKKGINFKISVGSVELKSLLVTSSAN